MQLHKEKKKKKTKTVVKRTVDPHGAGPELAGNVVSLADVLGPDTGGETVDRVVGTLDDLIDLGVLHDRHHGAEDLLAGDGHVIGHVGEDGGGHEVALVAHAGTADSHAGALLLADVDEVQNALHLLLRDLGTLLGLGVERVAHPPLLGELSALLNELVVLLLVHEHTRT